MQSVSKNWVMYGTSEKRHLVFWIYLFVFQLDACIQLF